MVSVLTLHLIKAILMEVNMGKKNLSLLITVLGLVVLAGCTLNEAPNGVKCRNQQYYKFGNGKVCQNLEECKPYLEGMDDEIIYAMSYGLCPNSDLFECKASDNGEYCNYKNLNNLISCHDGMIDPMSNPKHCGARGMCTDTDNPDSDDWVGKDCTKNNGYCQSGRCVNSSKCGLGTHFDSEMGECVQDSGVDCGVEHLDCASKDLYCSEGECVSGCPNDALLCGSHDDVMGVCVVPNTNSAYCGAVPGEREGICSGFKTCGLYQKCVDGGCVCNTGYHLAGTEDNIYCEADTDESCGKPDTFSVRDCTTIKNAVVSQCISGIGCKIYLCEEGYHVYDNDELNIHICEPDSVEHCGNHELNCSIENAESTCTNRYCSFECHTGYHKSSTGDACVENTPESCGSEEINCTEKDGWKTGICVNNRCIVETCTEGYHLYQSECELDSSEHCGEHDTRCNVAHADNFCVDKECQFTCDPDYREADGYCVSASSQSCGEPALNCSEVIPGWVNGTCFENACYATECGNQYYAEGGNCVKSDDNNCGKVGLSCKISHGTGKCVNNQCSYSCDNNYHLTDFRNGCEINSLENCGKENYKCEEQVEGWSEGSCSEAGKCVVSTCTDDYHYYEEENKCEKDTALNCGEHGHSCEAPENSNPVCLNKICAISCHNDYHLNFDSDACDADSITNCGRVGANCNNFTGWSDTLFGTDGEGVCLNGFCSSTVCTNSILEKYELVYIEDIYGVCLKDPDVLNNSTVSCPFTSFNYSTSDSTYDYKYWFRCNDMMMCLKAFKGYTYMQVRYANGISEPDIKCGYSVTKTKREQNET